MGEIHTMQKELENLKERQLGRPRRRWEYNIRMVLRKIGENMWTECISLRIGTSGGLL
jgi:hypothetical protein